MIEALIPDEKRKWRPRRSLTAEEQADQVEGALGGATTCDRCGLRVVEPWKNSTGNAVFKHYLCPGDDRKLVIRPFVPGGRWGTTPNRKPSYVGTIGAVRVLEIFKNKNGQHTYVYRTVLDNTISLRVSDVAFASRIEALNHAKEFLAKNVQWTPPDGSDNLSNDILADLNRRGDEKRYVQG